LSSFCGTPVEAQQEGEEEEKKVKVKVKMIMMNLQPELCQFMTEAFMQY